MFDEIKIKLKKYLQCVHVILLTKHVLFQFLIKIKHWIILLKYESLSDITIHAC